MAIAGFLEAKASSPLLIRLGYLSVFVFAGIIVNICTVCSVWDLFARGQLVRRDNPSASPNAGDIVFHMGFVMFLMLVTVGFFFCHARA